MRARPIISLPLAAAVAAALAACGGSSGNGITSQSASQIAATATKNVQNVKSIRVSGAFTEGGSHTITLDLRLVAGQGATGTMSENGGGFRLVVIADKVYVNGTASFWKQYGGTRTASRLTGKWLEASSTSGSFGDLAEEVRLRSLLSTLLTGHGGLTKGAVTTIDGRKVIPVHDNSKGGTLYVTTSGTAYPIELVNAANHAKVTFSAFNAHVPLTAPAGAVPITQLKN